MDSDVLSAVPVDRVVHLADITTEQLAVTLDPLPDNAPVVVSGQLSELAADPAGNVATLLDLIEAVARAQLPAWLPAANSVDDTSDAQRRTIRRLARESAGTSVHFGPMLADLAEAALLGRPMAPRWDPETRARGLVAVLADCYRRTGVVLALWSEVPQDADRLSVFGTAAQWLCSRASIGVWLIGEHLVEAGRFPEVTPSVRVDVESQTGAPPNPDYPVLAGRPHPGSAVELRFETALARCGWARGRAWNHVHQPHPLAPPIRVDLMWPHERVVVELDGPDHRGTLKYADDRRRDNSLTLAGFSVLRFANHEVDDDVSRVLAMIEELLGSRRRVEGSAG